MSRRRVRSNPRGVPVPVGLGTDPKGNHDYRAGPRIAAELGGLAMQVAFEIERDFASVRLGRGPAETRASLPVLARIVRGLYALRYMRDVFRAARVHTYATNSRADYRKRFVALRAKYEAAARRFDAFAAREAARIGRDQAVALGDAEGRTRAAMRVFAAPVQVGSIATMTLAAQAAYQRFVSARDTAAWSEFDNGVAAIRRPIRDYFDAVAVAYPKLGGALLATITADPTV